MTDRPVSNRGAEFAPIVFLHIPKTAGQTIHNALAQRVGADHVSPVRVNAQAAGDGLRMPPGFSLYSGHIDWTELETLPEQRFVFTVLRDPRERIASFYFYLLKEAEAMSAEDLARKENTGKRAILTRPAEEYFFGGAPAFRRFVRDHYHNFYCGYLATRTMRGWKQMRELSMAEKVAAALQNAPLIDRFYSTLDLGALETDIAARYGWQISVVDTFVNKGNIDRSERRWPRLLEKMETDKAARKLDRFVAADLELIDRLGVTV
jgi:hypothetical protein